LARAALLAAAGACDRGAPAVPALEGTWTSRADGQPVVLVLRGAESAAGTDVVGTAWRRTRAGLVTEAVRGTWRPPRLQLALVAPAGGQLDATVSGDTLRGRWVLGPYDGAAADLVRTSRRSTEGPRPVPPLEP
jgi:hypothetical protein